MKGRLPIGPFDPCLREPLVIEVEIEGGCVTKAELRAGLGRRDVEQGFDGLVPDEALDLVARICGRASMAHSFAFCQALEAASRIEVEPGPSALRVVLAEYERIAAHLGVISDTGRSLEDDIVYRGPRRYMARIRDAFGTATGTPFGFGAIVPGGVKLPGGAEAIDMLSGIHRPLERESSFWEKKMALSRKRLSGARLLLESMPGDGPPAPAFRASGYDRDLRSGENAYGLYGELACEPVVARGGRALDRLLVLTGEIRASLSIIRQAGDRGPEPGTPGEIAFRKGNGVGVSESPEGAVEHLVFLGSEGRIIRNRVNCAAAGVAEAVCAALEGVNYEDLVPSLLSFNLCAACLDR